VWTGSEKIRLGGLPRKKSRKLCVLDSVLISMTTTPQPLSPSEQELLANPRFALNCLKLGLEPVPDCSREDLQRGLSGIFDLVGQTFSDRDSRFPLR
jgi:hypothetical protein